MYMNQNSVSIKIFAMIKFSTILITVFFATKTLNAQKQINNINQV